MRILWAIFLFMVCCTSSFADCDKQARAAFKDAMSFGQMHFEKTEWNKNFWRRSSGRVVPKVGYHIKRLDKDGNIKSEKICLFRKGCWENDGLGWIQPAVSLGFEPFARSKRFSLLNKITQTKCVGRVKLNGAPAELYELQTEFTDVVTDGLKRQKVSEKIFADPATGLPIRREHRGSTNTFVNSDTIYRYDSSIVIEPPLVDLKKRMEKSIAILEASASKTDPKCRRTVLAAIRHGVNSGPFQFEITGDGLGTGAWKITGIVEPPDRKYSRIYAFPRHGGEREEISIGSSAWTKDSGQGWQRLRFPDPTKYPSLQKEKSKISRLERFAPRPNFVGYAECNWGSQKEEYVLISFEYELYRDFLSARKPYTVVRTTMDQITGLPSKKEFMSLDRSVVSLIEVRMYDRNLKVEEPIVATEK